MRNIFLTLSCLFGLLLLSGCGNDPAAQLEQDSGKIVEQAIIKELNKQIEASYGNQSFLLEPRKLMLVSSGVNQAVNSSGSDSFKPLEIIMVARKYNASKIACEVVGVSSSQVRKKKNSNYPYQAKLTISVNITFEEYHDFSGFPLHAVIPADWGKWNPRKQAGFVRELYSKLPPAEFDYRVIAETPAANTETMRDNWNIEVVWNKAGEQWEISGTTETEAVVNAPPPSWQGTEKDKNAIKQYLASQGFVAYRNRNFQPADLEIVQKLEQGLIYSNGRWQDPRVLEATEAFHTALERWNKSRAFPDLALMLKELNRLSDTESFPDYAQLATAGLLGAIKTMEQRRDEKFLEQLSFTMKNNSSFAAISPEKVQEAIDEAQKHINQQKQAQIKGKIKGILTEQIELQNILKTFAPTEITFSSFAGINELQAYANTNESVKNYLVLLGLVHNRPDLIGNRKVLSQQLFVDLLQDCRKCAGKGKIVCSSCKDSGVCQICGGSGRKTITTLAFDSRRGFVKSTVSCPRKCRLCPANPTCSSCSGTGTITLKSRAKKRMIDYYDKIMTDLNEDIEKQQKELEK